MLSLFEPEEVVGRQWHRLVGRADSYPRHPEAAVSLDAVRARLAVFFRGMGGDGGVRIAAGNRSVSGHRLTFKQRIGLGSERIERPALDGQVLALPAQIDLFPEAGLNAALYEWLAAFFAHAQRHAASLPADPLQADLTRLRLAFRATEDALSAWPGLRPVHRRLCEALLAVRPRRPLSSAGPISEADVEATVRHLLGAPDALMPSGIAGLVRAEHPALAAVRAPRRYHAFLPVPLWGEITPSQAKEASTASDEEGGDGAEGDGRRRRAARRSVDQTERDDPLMLNRFEKILGLAEMVNVNRPVEDDEKESAQQAADDLDEVSVGRHERKVATKLKFDLDLPPEAVDASAVSGELTYPEWDYRAQAHHRDHCRIVLVPPETEGEDWKPDDAAFRRIRAVRRQFEALRPRYQTFHAQMDGDDLDLSALVRARADLKANGLVSDRLYIQSRKTERDLAVAVLVDASLSTDGWIQNRRVLDVEKEALMALVHGLNACGDDHAVFTFTSRKRAHVRITALKGFDETLGPAVERRIQALRPGYYTRMGAAIRYVTDQLSERPNRHRLMIVLTDGKPNDLDHYEGRYGVEDTREAVREARQKGLTVFGVTVDSKAHDYIPYLFGRGAFAIVGEIGRLPAALPKIYRQLIR